MSFIKQITEAKEILSVITAVAAVFAVVIGGINYLTLNSIQPVLAHLQELDMQVAAIDKANQDDVSQSDFQNVVSTIRAEMKTRDEDIIHRLDIISGRLDTLLRK